MSTDSKHYSDLTVYGILGVNGNFTFPTTDGAGGQVLQTDGGGTVTWEDGASGGTSIVISGAGAGSTMRDNLYNTASGRYSSVLGSGNTATGTYSSVLGGCGNTISGASVEGAIIGGGFNNVSTSIVTFIGGGASNNTCGTFSSVLGGSGNTASGQYATIGGGHNNGVSGSSATIGGGHNNSVTGSSATIGGGSNNSVTGTSTTIGGGSNNTLLVFGRP